MRARFSLLLIATVLSACSSGSTGSLPSGTDTGTDSGDAPDAPLETDLDFAVDLQFRTAGGELAPSTWSVGLRDAETGELVAFETLDTLDGNAPKESSFARTFPGVLKRGRSYRVGMTSRTPRGCLQAPATVWYHQIEAVAEHIVLKKLLVEAENTDIKGCEMLFEPVPLAEGLWVATPGPGYGGSESSIQLVVSPAGRIYQQELMVTCPDQVSGCHPALEETLFPCWHEVTPLPGSHELYLYNSGDNTEVFAIGTIDSSATNITLQGQTVTSKASTACCVRELFETMTFAGPALPGWDLCP